MRYCRLDDAPDAGHATFNEVVYPRSGRPFRPGISLTASKPRPSQDRTARSLSATGSNRTATMHPSADLFLVLGEDRESRVMFLVGRGESFH